MERPQYTGRGTVMTAPVRHSAPTPERDAPRGSGEGMVAFGRGMQGLAQGVDQINTSKEHEKAKLAAERKRIDDGDLRLAAKRIASEAEIATREKFNDLEARMPDNIEEPTSFYRTKYQALMTEHRKNNPNGEMSEEEARMYEDAAPERF